MAELLDLHEAVAGLVHDGDSVALEGFTHLIPFAAGHEILRQGRKELELIRMTPDVLYDQMIGTGAARKLVFSYARVDHKIGTRVPTHHRERQLAVGAPEHA